MELKVIFESGDEIVLKALTLDEATKKCLIMFPQESFKIVNAVNSDLLFIIKR